MQKKISICLLMFMGMCGISQSKSIEWKWPGQDTSVVYLYDFVGDQNFVGLETPVLSYKKKIDLTIGFATKVEEDIEKEIPFAGLKKYVSNRISIGAFLGREFQEGESIAGIKANIQLWGK